MFQPGDKAQIKKRIEFNNGWGDYKSFPEGVDHETELEVVQYTGEVVRGVQVMEVKAPDGTVNLMKESEMKPSGTDMDI